MQCHPYLGIMRNNEILILLEESYTLRSSLTSCDMKNSILACKTVVRLEFAACVKQC